MTGYLLHDAFETLGLLQEARFSGGTDCSIVWVKDSPNSGHPMPPSAAAIAEVLNALSGAPDIMQSLVERQKQNCEPTPPRYAVFHPVTDAGLPTFEQVSDWTPDLHDLSARLAGFAKDLGDGCVIFQGVAE